MTRAVVTQFLADTSNFTRATQEAGESAGKFGTLMAGIGAGIGISAFNIAQTAFSDLGETLSEAAQAARDDQTSQSHLSATLRENIPAWNDATGGIEAYIAQMEDATAFSKNDLRDSLSQLVGATGDVTKAESDQAIAANLARYANESLATATQQIVDVEAGRYTGLRSLGINIKDVTSSQDALNKVEDIAAQQSYDYLKTPNGLLDLQNQKLEDQRVQLGKSSEGWDLFTAKINTDMMESLSTQAGGISQDFDELGDAWNFFTGLFDSGSKTISMSTDESKASFAGWVDEVTGDLGAAGVAATDTFDHFQTGLGVATDTFENWSGVVTRLSKSTSAAMVSDLESTLSVWSGKWDALESIATDAIETIYGAEDRASALAATNREIADQRIILSSKKSTASQKADAEAQLLSLTETSEKEQIIMAGHGELTKTQYAALIAELDKQAASANDDVATAARLALAELKKLQDQLSHTNVPDASDTGYGSATKPKHRARGGSLAGGDISWVGEEGPELWVAPSNGSIIPNDSIGGMGHSGGVRSGHVTVVPLPVPAHWTPGRQREFAQEAGPAIAKWMQENGLLPRFGGGFRN